MLCISEFNIQADGSRSLAIQVSHTDEEWLKILGKDAYHIMRDEGTERPFSR